MIKSIPFQTICLCLLLSISSCRSHQDNISFIEETPWGTEEFNKPVFPNRSFNIVHFGADTLRSSNNQNAIQAAIDSCKNTGGGIVVIPKGRWQTSYIELKSNTNLHLEEGAVLNFIDSIELYETPTFTRWEGIECMNYHPLLYARNAENIAITGSGKINGNGARWWSMAKGKKVKTLSKLYDQVEANIPPEKRNCLNYEDRSYLRPSLIQAINCKNILVEGIEVGSGPMWTLHFVYCTNVIARNLRIITTGVNNDGIIPDACKKVLIDNCYFSTGDDCIVIKSGLNEDGWRVGKASERIVIKDCKTKHGHGGVVIGSEMSGGVRNVYAYNCDFSHTQRGLRVKSMKGRGGIVENLWFKDIIMDSIYNEAIKINMNYGSSSIAPRSDSLPIFRNFNFNNVTSSYSRHCVRLIGIKEQNIEGLSFTNLKMKGKYGIIINNARNISFDSISIETLYHEPLQITRSNNLLFKNANFIALHDTLMLAKDSCKNIRLYNTNLVDFRITSMGK